jgi:hypothetical protein
MSYHQIILTSREERPINEDTLHDLLWNVYDQCRRTSGGYPTVRLLDVKGNVINEATRRLLDQGWRTRPPSIRNNQFEVSEDQPEIGEDSEEVSPNLTSMTVTRQLEERGYPLHLFGIGPDITTIADQSNPDWATRLTNLDLLGFPDYSALVCASNYDQHNINCECGECYAHDSRHVQRPLMKALMTLACSRDGWRLSVDNIDRAWFNDLAPHYARITGERP